MQSLSLHTLWKRHAIPNPKRTDITIFPVSEFKSRLISIGMNDNFEGSIIYIECRK